MSRPEVVQVDTVSLVAHARKVDQIGDGLTTAAEAGQTVQTDTGAYGQLCQFVPMLLNGLQQAMVDGMSTAAKAAHDTAEAVRSAAAEYDRADGDSAERLRNTS